VRSGMLDRLKLGLGGRMNRDGLGGAGGWPSVEKDTGAGG
jgi:hypothetical protein